MTDSKQSSAASAREALEKSDYALAIAENAGMNWSAHMIKLIREARELIDAALSDPAPAAPTREEIIEECAKVADDLYDDAPEGCGWDGGGETVGWHGASSTIASKLREMKSKRSQAETVESAAIADQIIGQIEDRFPDWRSYRDLIDCIDVTLHRLRGGK